MKAHNYKKCKTIQNGNRLSIAEYCCFKIHFYFQDWKQNLLIERNNLDTYRIVSQISLNISIQQTMYHSSLRSLIDIYCTSFNVYFSYVILQVVVLMSLPVSLTKHVFHWQVAVTDSETVKMAVMNSTVVRRFLFSPEKFIWNFS